MKLNEQGEFCGPSVVEPGVIPLIFHISMEGTGRRRLICDLHGLPTLNTTY